MSAITQSISIGKHGVWVKYKGGSHIRKICEYVENIESVRHDEHEALYIKVSVREEKIIFESYHDARRYFMMLESELLSV